MPVCSFFVWQKRLGDYTSLFTKNRGVLQLHCPERNFQLSMTVPVHTVFPVLRALHYFIMFSFMFQINALFSETTMMPVSGVSL